MVEEGTPSPAKEPTAEPPVKKSILEETKDAIAELKKEREDMNKILDELRQLRSDQLLSSTAGIKQEPEQSKEETPAEYSKRVMSGGLNEKASQSD